MAKECSRPRTRKGRRKPKWDENPQAARPCWFESGPGHQNVRQTARAFALRVPSARWGVRPILLGASTMKSVCRLISHIAWLCCAAALPLMAHAETDACTLLTPV